MKDFEISIDLQAAENVLSTVGLQFREAAVASLNETVAAVREKAVVFISSKYNIPRENIRGRIRTRAARDTNLEAAVIASGAKIDLIEFSPEGTPAGVTVIVKENVRKLINLPGDIKAFIVTPKSGRNAGKAGIYVRQGAERFPIRRLYGPSVPQLFGSRNIMSDLEPFALETVEATLGTKLQGI